MYIVNKNDKLNWCKIMLFSDPIFKEQKSSYEDMNFYKLLLHSVFSTRIECRVGNLSPAMGTRNQGDIGLSHRPASLYSLASGYSIPDSFPGIDSSPHSGT